MSDSINDGGPAFPGEIGFGCMHDNMHQTGTSVAQWYGMSLQDHFAGLAMQALIADPVRADQSREECARLSYAMATAMINERKAQQ